MQQQVKYHGACLCGAVQYTLDQDFEALLQCHCQKCRKATGTAFATNGLIAKAAFHLQKGETALKSFASSPDARRYFCGQCGSPVYSIKTSAPKTYRIRVGLIEEDLSVSVQQHVFVGSKANWDHIYDGLPQWQGFPK